MNVLIVDDDPEDTMLFCETLLEVYPDAKCISENDCNNLENTLRSKGTDIDFVFLDANMHPIGGRECLMKLLKIVDRDRTKIIVYSGALNHQQISEFKSLGAHDALIKAGNLEDLRNLLSKMTRV